MMNRPCTYDEAVRYLLDLPKFTKKNKPGNTLALLRLLGSPEEKFRVVHVAGTNGKGSVCAFLESIFRQAGLRTGMFTSPHLIRINERFQIDRRQISDEKFLESFFEVYDTVCRFRGEGGMCPTFFEYMFLIAMVCFAREGVEITLCETGLGGRLDATNTIACPMMSVITSISLDHTAQLGNTVELIAGEKAGIIKKEVPVIYEAQDFQPAQVIARKAEEMNAPQIPLTGQAVRVLGCRGNMLQAELFLRDGEIFPFEIAFSAEYQARNASLAILAARQAGIGDGIIRTGLKTTEWAARLERILPDVWLDGAHNPGAARALNGIIRKSAARGPVSLLFAMVSDKDYRSVVREVCRGVSYQRVTVTQVEGGRMLPAVELAEEFLTQGQKYVYVSPNSRDAFEEALSRRDDSVLYCAGSLYLAGAIESILHKDFLPEGS